MGRESQAFSIFNPLNNGIKANNKLKFLSSIKCKTARLTIHIKPKGLQKNLRGLKGNDKIYFTLLWMQGKDKKDLSNKYNFPCLEENIAKKSLISL